MEQFEEAFEECELRVSDSDEDEKLTAVDTKPRMPSGALAFHSQIFAQLYAEGRRSSQHTPLYTHHSTHCETHHCDIRHSILNC